MSVNHAALWILMILCCIVAVPAVLRINLARARPERPRDVLRLYADAILTGVGVGQAVAFITLVLAALLARL